MVSIPALPVGTKLQLNKQVNPDCCLLSLFWAKIKDVTNAGG